MAILDLYPGFEVNVSIDGVALPEYDDDEEEAPKPGPVGAYQASRTVTKYIESVSDKEFAIEIKLNRGFVMNCGSLTARITIDGQVTNRPNIPKSTHAAHFLGDTVVHPLRRKVEGRKTAIPNKPGYQMMKKYRFSKIVTSMDDEKLRDFKEDTERIDQVGEICIVVRRSSEPMPSRSSYSRRSAIPTGITNVHEKALKGQAKSHTTSLGPGSPVHNSYVSAVDLDGKEYPQAIFKFKYRSRDALKSLLIIPRTPSPEYEIISLPAPTIHNVSTDFVKKERGTPLDKINSNGGPSVKRERDDGGEGSLRKKRKSEQSVTIDLTEDSDGGDIICLN